jgi:hypothetical protein
MHKEGRFMIAGWLGTSVGHKNTPNWLDATRATRAYIDSFGEEGMQLQSIKIQTLIAHS